MGETDGYSRASVQESSEPHRIESIFPEPETVPGNVAVAGYDERLLFIRQSLAVYSATCGAVAAAALALPSRWGWVESLALYLVGLIVLSAQRRLVTGPKSLFAELAVLTPTLLGLALLLQHVHEANWPVWVFGLTSACIGLYTALCGRDFSFLGMFVLATVGMSATLVASKWLFGVTWMELWTAFALGIAHIAYVAYDLAALLCRRRSGEHVQAAIDLYRDLLNFTTYSVRVLRHWQGYKFS